MRKIKFRAWLEEDKCYVRNGVYIEPIYSGKCIEDGYIYEQFTGLLDKNGKEIYEGDILIDKYKNIGTCHWEPSNWVFIDHSGFIEFGEPWEVIGNIHENPELLETTK